MNHETEIKSNGQHNDQFRICESMNIGGYATMHAHHIDGTHTYTLRGSGWVFSSPQELISYMRNLN